MDIVHVAPESTYIRQVTIYTDAAETTAENLTGGTVTADVLDRPGGTHRLDAVSIVTDAANGAAQVTIPPTNLPYSVLYVKVVYNDSSGESFLVDEWKYIVDGVS